MNILQQYINNNKNNTVPSPIVILTAEVFNKSGDVWLVAHLFRNKGR